MVVVIKLVTVDLDRFWNPLGTRPWAIEIPLQSGMSQKLCWGSPKVNGRNLIYPY